MKIKLNYILILTVFIIFSSIIVYAGAVIVDFRGEPATNKVILRWSSVSEFNCKEYQIERSLDRIEFKKVGFKDGAGNSSTRIDYLFEDKSVYKTTINRTFYYRIKIINMDNSESVFTQIVAVTPSISGARYTWGSIKALFR